MAFLDNSGDIILDAVLTDAGRARLARGDGSFKIVKYAFADDEIDYGKYDLNHASGSAYFDINILTTPVIEALTNNTSTMKTKLLSIPKTNLLYLPVIKINEETSDSSRTDSGGPIPSVFVVSVDSNTDNGVRSGDSTTSTGTNVQGVFLSGDGISESRSIKVDQGLNTTAISKEFTIDPTLKETQYILEIDNRLGYLMSPGANGQQMDYSFLDDDNIASYSLSVGDVEVMVSALGAGSDSPIQGPRGTRLSFRIAPSIELNSSTYLFTLLGTSENTYNFGNGSLKYRRIDSNVTITGATTGYRITIPVTFLKYESA